MEYSYYRDSRHHYLTIPCEAVETYQYRMLAANRMDALLPCSIRNVDGKRYLYYDITARENMGEFFRGHGSAPQEIPALLYAIADAGAVLERYLLDCGRLLLAPEFVFYDYTRGEFAFLYYPEDQMEASGPAFYEYLADHADPQDKMLYYTLLRLISISANRTFVLEDAFLEKSLGRKRPEKGALSDREGMEAAGIECGNGTCKIHTDRTCIEKKAEGDDTLAGELELLEKGDEKLEKAGEKEAGDPHKRIRRLVIFIILAIMLLAGAIGLAGLRLYVPMNETQDKVAMAGMIGCLMGSIMIAVYGGYRGARSSRQELRSVRDEAKRERRNALSPVEDFR